MRISDSSSDVCSSDLPYRSILACPFPLSPASTTHSHDSFALVTMTQPINRCCNPFDLPPPENPFLLIKTTHSRIYKNFCEGGSIRYRNLQELYGSIAGRIDKGFSSEERRVGKE